jgi:hypothetical protein
MTLPFPVPQALFAVEHPSSISQKHSPPFAS